jgi:membrane-associated phospholipid phosphatase
MFRVCSSSLLVACGLVSIAQAVAAQSVAKMIGDDVGHAAKDVLATWRSPFTASPDDWWMAGAGIAVAIVASPADVPVDRWFLDNRQNSAWSALRAFREGGPAFSGRTITPVAVGLYAIGLATKSTAIRNGVWGCVAAYGAESIIRTQVFYRIIGRERPDSARGDHHEQPSEHGDQYQLEVPASKAWGDHSFPAGHVANVAACASFLTYRFSSLGVAIPSNALMAAVGIGRMVDRRHWNSDTLLGALFGYAVGKEVALRSLNRLREQGSPSATANRFVISWQTTF